MTRDWSVLRDVTWWSWVLMIGLLIGRFAGYVEAIGPAIVVCWGLGTIDLVRRRGDWLAMSVQVRFTYAAMLVLGLLPGMAWLHGVQLVGTTARVVTGYCLLERELRIMPWHAVEPMTLRAMWRTLTAKPGAGGLLRFGDGPACACMPGYGVAGASGAASGLGASASAAGVSATTDSAAASAAGSV